VTFLGKTIRLKGKTQKGKNRVRENGETWTVFAETDRVLFAPNNVGPWLFISPDGKNQDDKTSRWINGLNDVDFEIVIQVDNT